MAKTKRMLALFSLYDRTGIERRLEKLAREGWQLEKAGAFFWRFRQAEPACTHFAVSYFPAASSFDAQPGEDQLLFLEMCEHTGWQPVFTNAQLQVFRSDLPDPVPIETDPALEVENIHAAMKKSMLPVYWLDVLLAVMQHFVIGGQFLRDPIDMLAGPAALCSLLCWSGVLLFTGCELAGYYRWRHAAKKAAAEGRFLPTKGHTWLQVAALAAVFAALGLLLLAYAGSRMLPLFLLTILFLFGMMGAALGFAALLKRLKLPAKKNKILTILLVSVLTVGLTVFLCWGIFSVMRHPAFEKQPTETYYFRGHEFHAYADALPLRLEELGPVDYTGYSTLLEEKESFLVRVTRADQYTRMDALDQPELFYRVVEVKLPVLYGICQKTMLEDFAHNYGYPEEAQENWKQALAVDAAPWGAEKAWQLSIHGQATGRYLLAYADRLVEVEFEDDWPLTDPQKALVGEKLGS